MTTVSPADGGERIAEVLVEHGVETVFTLCGGHISPILVGARRRGIRIVDTRHEVNAVFAADAWARLTGVPGVAAVTAGPGVTNTITAIKNAQLAQSPVVVLGGATAGLLRGRGALQDIDQHALIRPHVKAAIRVRSVAALDRAVSDALGIARSGVPGPVFVECPVDLLYAENVVRQWFEAKSSRNSTMRDRVFAWYLRRYASRIFAGADDPVDTRRREVARQEASRAQLGAIRKRLSRSSRPLMIVGSQAVQPPEEAGVVADAIERLGVPVYLTGMARGLLGREHPLQLRHRRRSALKNADLVILAGVPCDFRLDYGRQIGRRTLISINRSSRDLNLNRRPDIGVLAEPGRALVALATEAKPDRSDWIATLRASDDERETEIAESADEVTEALNPLALCRAIDDAMDESSIIVADGGDFVSTASYIVRPRGPLSWLDPGVFGTLGVGAGFAMAAKLARPAAEVWILYGDGSVGFSIAELDTFARHGIPVIAVVGNDGCWSQIAREQVEILGDDTGCALGRSEYHEAAEGLGARGLLLREPSRTREVLGEAKEIARSGRPVLINAWIGSTDFRKGSISI